MVILRHAVILIQSLFFAIALLSCEAPESHKKNEATGKMNSVGKTNTMTPFVYRGMYDLTGNFQLTDCSSGKQYKVSNKSDLTSVDNAVKQMQNNLKKETLFIEAEGFISTEQNISTKQNDTVLVIGRISRIDIQFDCNPHLSKTF